MPKQLQALLDAHVQFELRQWRDKAMTSHLDAEAQTLWRWLSAISLNQLADKQRVQDAARRLALDMPVPDALTDTIVAMAQHLLRLPKNHDTTLSEVLDQALFDEGVELIGALKDARASAIHSVSNNPLYTAMASELIYNGIRDYLFSDQALLNRIPGLSSLMSAGSSAVNRSAPGLEAQVEKRVRAYIETNLGRTLENSETFLLEALTEERIRELGDKLWSRLSERPLAIGRALTDDDIATLVGFGHRLWCQLRETEYLADMLDAGVAQFFALHGEDSVAALLERIGLSEQTLAAEAVTIVPPLAKVADEAGYLEGFVRRRLEPFYQSEAAAEVLKS